MLMNYRIYEGDENFAFISYCRSDIELCKKLLAAMDAKGIRMWYDNAVQPGSNWLDIIAEHLDRCKVCVALITDDFIKSYNCNDELAFAKERHIPVIPVIVDDCTITCGMGLALAGSQHVKINSRSERNFQKVLESSLIKECVGSSSEPVKEAEEKLVKKSAEAAEAELTQHIAVFSLSSGFYSLHRSSGRELNFEINSERNPSQKLLGVSLRASGSKITNVSEGCVYINYQRLGPGQSMELPESFAVKAGEESYFAACGNLAVRIINADRLGLLENRNPEEELVLWQPETVLGRSAVWTKGSLDDELLDGRHALIKRNDRFYISDSGDGGKGSKNGVLLNRELLEPGAEKLLKDGDYIQLGNSLLRFRELQLRSR